MSLIPFGLKEDVLVEVNDVDQGLACGCVCPACRAPLVARKGQVNIHHFAHHSRAACAEAMGQALLLAIVEVLQQPVSKLGLPGPNPRILTLEAVTQPATVLPGGAAVQVWYRQRPLQLFVEWDHAAGADTREQWLADRVPSVALNLTAFVREIQHRQQKQIRKADIQGWLLGERYKSWIYRTPRPPAPLPEPLSHPGAPVSPPHGSMLFTRIQLPRPAPIRPPVFPRRSRESAPPGQDQIRLALLAQLAHCPPRSPVDVDLFVFRIESAIKTGILDDAGRRYLFKKSLLPSDDTWVGQVLQRLGYGVE
ncbi:hypothetical protein CEK28_08810 [Xenophilus sp. AP218F]|nr:hypothetical protein CEK28_08810 [Xenophilus sp. AP218F]